MFGNDIHIELTNLVLCTGILQSSSSRAANIQVGFVYCCTFISCILYKILHRLTSSTMYEKRDQNKMKT